MVLRRIAAPGILALLLLGTGCGARTGLLLPDAGAAPDAGQDAGLPETCVHLPLDPEDVVVDLETEARLAVADVMLVIDATASMHGEIDNIQRRLRDRIVPGIAEALPDVEFGVAVFADFADRSGQFGTGTDQPFRMLLPITGDLIAAQAAVDLIPSTWNGADTPESQVEALYQVATGEGLVPWIPAAAGCPSGGTGYPCFRSEAIPIILLFTDAPFHNGPDGRNPYRGLAGPPHVWEDAIGALLDLGARFIGLDSGDAFASGSDHMRQTARAIGSVTVDGRELVFDIGSDGEGLGRDVVRAVETLADAVRFDVDAIVRDVPGDDIDATQFVVSIVPLRAEPPSGVAAIDETTFRGVVPGTTVVFLLTVRNDSVVPGPEPRVVPLRVIFRGDGHSPIAEQIVNLLIPGTDDPGECPE